MRRTGIIALIVALGLGLAACGVRGDLDPPPGGERKTDEPFVLDPLV